jgi:uncharacterized SAM-binding protein YcdF (DUF218 family)
MFLLKKLIGFLLAPGTIILFLLGYGLLRLVLSGKSKLTGCSWIFLGTLCFYVFSTAHLPHLLLFHLESQYKPVGQLQNPTEIQYIVVLSGRIRCNINVPPTSQLGESTALQVVEGVRLYHLLSAQPMLIMSGGGELQDGTRMAAFARCLGMPGEKLIAETKSLDTSGNAREVKAIIQEAPFLLVTSASHLPRAMKIFQFLGMKPIPAPADFRYCEKVTFTDFIPAANYLDDMHASVHEYLGLGYLKLFPGRVGR